MTPSKQAVHPLLCALTCAGVLTPVGVALANSAASVAEPVPAQAAPSPAPALMHARHWHVGDDPRSYWVSEKLDGVRAYWDGQTLRFRSGVTIAAPAWFVAALPATPLDGELWLGRGRFDELSGTVRRKEPVDADWRKVHYMVFDLPGAQGTFTERTQRLSELLAQAQTPWLQAVAQQRVRNAAALHTLLRQTLKLGGEGLVLHRARALWAPGRSDALLKLKLHADDEARVVAHLPGKGRNQGRLGALLLEMPDGKRFALGTGFTDAQRADPPAVGALVTYRYRDLSPKGLPRAAVFVRERGVE